MKNPVEVLRRKEAELRKLQQEVQGLRQVCNFVTEQEQTGGSIGTLVQTPQIYQA